MGVEAPGFTKWLLNPFVGFGFYPGIAWRHCECLVKGVTVEFFIVH